MAVWQTDAVVIGAGVVGLAVGRSLAMAGHETVVLERHNLIGSETSARNSEVIHAGIYYPPGSLKAQACVRGKALLYEYLRARNLPHRQIGKLIVAGSRADEEALDEIAQRSVANEVSDLERLTASAVHELAPDVRAESALFSPSTGIIDSHQYMLSLQADLEAAGGVLALASQVTGGQVSASGDHRIEVNGGDELSCGLLVNCAGLDAASTWNALGAGSGCPAQHFAVGHYYSYSGRARFNHLIYPTPVPGGLGIHATLDMGGQVRFGPDVRWLESPNYDFDDSRRVEFAEAIERYYPGLDRSRLAPAYTGVRPKISGPGEPSADFRVLSASEHGLAGFVSLHGIESPGLTSSLALAERIVSLV
ncbi:MAG: NAD(P)/FAD-dependent oxidoreductase [Pseudomonadaceae bacterium]|nr:NAD(P)/FAD-dependent oxidoreductase [Pseudomonadaceae bacterium]